MTVPDPQIRPSSALLAAVEVSIVATIASVTLLYTPLLADNLLGKTALVHIFSGVTVLLWGLARAVEGRVTRPNASQFVPFLVFLVIAAVAGVRARNPMLAWETWLKWAQWLALFFVVADLCREVERARRLVLGVLCLAAVVSAIGLLQVVGFDLMSLPANRSGEPLSSLGNTNFVAHYLEVVLPLSLAVVVCGGWTRVTRSIAGVALALSSGLLILAGSRGGWLGVAVGLLAMFWAVPRPRNWIRRLLLAVLIIGLLSPVASFVLQSLPVAHERSAADVVEELVDASWSRALSTFDGANFSRTMRLLIWRDSVRVIRAHPWLGVGPGHLGYVLAANRTTTGQREWRKLMGTRTNEPSHAHNEFLETWADIGFFGAVALVWMLGASLHMAWRIGHNGRDGPAGLDRSIALGCLGGLAAATVHSLFSFNLRDPVSGTHVWILCGLVAACAARSADSQRPWAFSGPWRRAALVGGTAMLAAAGSYHGLCMLWGDVYFLQSQQHLANGHGNRAIDALRRAVEWRGYESSYHHWLGQMALQMKRYDEAAQALTRSLELNDDNPGAIRLLATALLAKGQGGQAIAPLRHAIAIDALTADNYSLLADALRQSGQPAAAVPVRRQAISLRGDPLLLVSLALDHDRAGHLDSALAVLAEALRTAPGDATIVGNLGALQVKAGDSVAGEKHLRQALALEPDRVQWSYNLGLALMAQRRFSEALEAAQAAVRLDPENKTWQDLVRRIETHNLKPSIE
ncbi:MAG: O-antigen ligase family protein [bacterium]|nr:O-antigen ligase family protein [bacterium]